MRQLIVAVALLGLAPAAAGQTMEDFELRFDLFDQHGHGFQSQAAAGSERATIWEPAFAARFRDGRDWIHDVTVSVDVVSAASPDALDAISSASRVNEAATVDMRSTYTTGATRLSARYGFHVEEPYRSGWLGAGWARDLADGNATVSLTVLAMGDFFDHITWTGTQAGYADRETLSINAAASQILSETTLVDASYGFTFQSGTLQTTWNSIPLADGGRGDEVFPGSRARQAFAVRLSQHIPLTHSTAKLRYRFYVDNYGLVAHTAEALAYQYLVPWIYLRGSARYYRQSGVDFYAPMFERNAGPRTSDSDLAPLTAEEFGIKAVLLADRSPIEWLRRSFLDLSFFRYRRIAGPDLDVTLVGAAFGMQF